MNEADSLEADNIVIKEGIHRHESSNDWDDLGIDFENASQTVSTNESSNTPRPRSNLDEVIDSVIQDALEYADAPPEKRVLPKLVRKSTKSKGKQLNINNIGSNNNANFPTIQNHQMTTNNHTTNALMSQTVATNNNSVNPLHPLMQANFGHPNMQQMAAQLQLAASGKGLVAGNNTSTSLMQHNMIASTGVTNNQTQQQQLTAAMMGFGASQIPNMMMPTYNGNVPITYHQQMAASGQYHLPVTFAQIQQLHIQQQQQQQQQQHQQQQQQQTQQHQQQQSHLLLSNNPNPSEMNAGTNSQQSNMNFATGSTTNTQQQQSMLPSSYTNFSNQAIAVTPYQIPGMMHAFASPSGPTNSSGTQLMSPNQQQQQQQSSVNINGVSSSVANSRYLSSTTSTNNSSINTNTNITLSNNNSSNIALSSNNSNNSNNSNHTNASVNIGASTITAASMASLYQQLPPNTFDFHQQQLLYNQRLLQVQQQQQQQQQQTTNNASAGGILSDYAVSRYGGGYQ